MNSRLRLQRKQENLHNYFQKISEAYGINDATLSSYEELNSYNEWFKDNEPCLLKILLPEDSLLTPKIKFETGLISPKLEDSVINEVTSNLLM